MMKKIILLTFVVLMCFASVCSAFNLDRERWVSGGVENGREILLDAQSIQFNERDTNVWICEAIEKENEYTFRNFSVPVDKREINLLEFIIYDYKTDKMKNSVTVPFYQQRISAIPGSYAESIYILVSMIRQDYDKINKK